MSIFKSKKSEEVENINLYDILLGHTQEIVKLHIAIEHPKIDNFIAININDEISLGLLPTSRRDLKIMLRKSNITLWHSRDGFCTALTTEEPGFESILKLIEIIEAKKKELEEILNNKNTEILTKIKEGLF
jgi:hypothetical protein